jgi:hypothetical protein
MSVLFGLGFLIVILVACGVVLLPTIFYLLTLQKALSKCSPYNRTMPPGNVWLQIIPVFGFVWQFFVIGALSSSLKREYDARRMPIEAQPGRSLGIAMGVLLLVSFIPYVGIPCGIAYLVLWIMYWVKISNYSRALDFAPAYPAGPGGGRPGPYYQSGGYQAPNYGTPPYAPAPYSPSAYSPPPYAAGPNQYQAPSCVPFAQAPQAPEPEPAPVPDHTSGWLSANARSTGKTCGSCGAALEEGSRVCSNCGTQAE